MNTARILTSMLLVIVMALAAGCGDKSSPVAPSTPAPNPAPQPGPEPEDGVDPALVGIWVYTEVTSNGRPADLATVLDWEENTLLAAFQVEADGFYAYAEFADGGDELEVVFYTEGTISTRGNQFTIRADDGSFSGNWSRSGSQLKLTYTAGGQKIALVAENLEDAAGSPSLTIAR